MKITNPLFTKALGLFGATLIRGWTATLDYRIAYQDPTVDPVHPRCRPRALYVLWHEYLICPLGVRGRGMTVLISQHRDGELITQVLRHLGFKVVRGSSTRGGIAAVKRVLRIQGSGVSQAFQRDSPGTIRQAGKPDLRLTSDSPTPGKTHLIITPDGPRGPRRQLEEGAIYLAARLAMPIVCMGFAFDRPWRLNSWDQFAIPRPFSRARAVISSYLEIPSTLARQGLGTRDQVGAASRAAPTAPLPGADCRLESADCRLADGTEKSAISNLQSQITEGGFEHYRLRVEQVLNQVTQEAEHWARAGNRKPGEMPFLRNEFPATPPYVPAMAGAHRRTDRPVANAGTPAYPGSADAA